MFFAAIAIHFLPTFKSPFYMKKMFLFVLLLPVTVIAQKFQISEQAGLSLANTINSSAYQNASDQTNGFSNQITASYHPCRHFDIGAFYELNSWNSKNNAYGAIVDFVSRHFFAGIDVKRASFEGFSGLYYTTTFKPSLGYGVHVGSKQKIYRGLSVIEQLGYGFINLKGTTIEYPDLVPYPAPPPVQVSFSQDPRYAYARVGLAYKF